MEVLFVIIIIFALVAIGIKTNNIAKKPKREYTYTKKACAMTRHELTFYKTLLEAISGCVIIPQAHLSMFLDHKVYGQNWNRAFSRINGKSVDFLICTNDMKPLIAIELDDNTHDRPDRQKRDIFVNSIISNANMPLLRFLKQVSGIVKSSSKKSPALLKNQLSKNHRTKSELIILRFLKVMPE